MISRFKIDNLNDSHFSYTIKYSKENSFQITLKPNINFTHCYWLTINFYILRTIIPDKNFYLSQDFAKLKLKPMEKL